MKDELVAGGWLPVAGCWWRIDAGVRGKNVSVTIDKG
jgi:hypothetical protein